MRSAESLKFNYNVTLIHMWLNKMTFIRHYTVSWDFLQLFSYLFLLRSTTDRACGCCCVCCLYNTVLERCKFCVLIFTSLLNVHITKAEGGYPYRYKVSVNKNVFLIFISFYVYDLGLDSD
jgi:hypothetical protein